MSKYAVIFMNTDSLRSSIYNKANCIYGHLLYIYIYVS